jgi:hypothetical protein
MVYQKLEGLLSHWQAAITQNTDDILVFQISQARNFFQKLIAGYQRDVEVQVRIMPPRIADSKMTDVSIWLRYIGRDKENAKQTLKEIGPNLLQELRTYLLALPDFRGNERFPYEHPLQVAPVFPDGQTGEFIECQGKDISRLGMGFIAPGTPPTTLLYVQTTEEAPVELGVLVRVLRLKPADQSRCEVAARFAIPDRMAPVGAKPVAVLDLDVPQNGVP